MTFAEAQQLSDRELLERVEELVRQERAGLVELLAPHLASENRLELLAAARHKTKRAIEVLVADLHPKPDVSTVLRCLAGASPPESPLAPNRAQERTTPLHPPPDSSPTLPLAASAAPERHLADTQTETPLSATQLRNPPASAGEPFGDQRYRLHLTLSSTTYQKLQEAQALLRHQLPDGDLAAVMDRALSLLLQEVKKQRFGLTERPRRPRGKTACRPSSRHIPADVRRRVFKRDAGRCTYVDAQGRRCRARDFLEFHHLDPWARDRHHDADRIALLCRAHNQREAGADFGRGFVEGKRRGGREVDWPRGQLSHSVAELGKEAKGLA